MKQNQITLIIIGFILVALMATNPSTEEHKEAVKEKVSAVIENNNSNGNAFQKLGEQLGKTIGMVIIDKMINRENYLIFSLTKSKKFLNKQYNDKIIGLGIFGKVYLFNEFSEKITEKIEESSNPIIGNTIKIENIEVADKDFPDNMNWEDAQKACAALGNGWRLPTKDELTILFKNKDIIGQFEGQYWSSTTGGIYGEDGKGTNYGPWVLNTYNNGVQFGNPIGTTNDVRAVRSSY